MIFTICIGMLLVLTCLDMGIKQYIEDTFKEGEERKTVVDRLILRKVYNQGFAFNLLDKYPDIIKRSSVFAAAGLLLYDLSVFFNKGRRFLKFGVTLVSAGAISNLYDRLIRGKVVDYIGVKSNNSRLSRLTANLADIYIVMGMFLVFVSQTIHKKR
ncbi:MAG: signal peptidase II [Lachnospiraceae bacterium]